MDRINFIYNYLKNTRTISGYFPIFNPDFLVTCRTEAVVGDDSLIPSPDVIEADPFYLLLEESTQFDEYYLLVDVDGKEFNLAI